MQIKLVFRESFRESFQNSEMAYSPSGFVETANETFILHMQKTRNRGNEQRVHSLSTSRSEG